MNAGGDGLQTSANVGAPTLDELARDPGRVRELAGEDAGALLLRVAALALALWSRVIYTGGAVQEAARRGTAAPDRLIQVKEAAKIIGMSPTTLYRNKDRYPFFVRNGNQVRFSTNGIARWIARRAGTMK